MENVKSDEGMLRLCEALIVSAIKDLYNKKHKQSSLQFFLSGTFRDCCRLCGYNYKSIIENVYEMSKLSDIQKQVRGKQIIAQLEFEKTGSANNVISIRRGGRKTH